ncbi:site-2 protease family protein [Rariglobus hedericola]
MNLFRIRGIQLSVHASFFLLLAYVAWQGWTAAAWQGAAWLTLGTVVMFVCVTLHELGHAAAARYFGIRVPRILLLPIGGMAEMESIPRRPREEIIIALAGPAVNYLIIGVLLIFVRFPEGWNWAYFELSLPGLGRYLVLVNLILGVFNLLPAFPMDGGRVLRALLAMRFPYLRATQIAAHAGKVVALAGAAYLVFYWKNYPACVLFGFIIFAGHRELQAVARKEKEAAHWRMIEARFNQPTVVTVTPIDEVPPRAI